MTSPDPERKAPLLDSPDILRPSRRASAATARKPRSLLLRLLWSLLLVVATVLALIVALRWVPPPITSFMLQSQTKPAVYQWVPRQRIAEPLRKAVVAAEDQKFWEHNGFDLEAIEKAYAHNQRSRKIRGASTISQQVSKNLFLWSGGGYFRKGLEATITVLIETLWSKDRILEVYLNIAEFGPGIYGVEAAASRFFGKAAAGLNAQEAARLAAVLPSPRRWNAGAPSAYVQKRTRWILGQMGYGRAAPADEPEPLPPPQEEEEMPALDSWENPPAGLPADEMPAAEPEAAPGEESTPPPAADAPTAEPEPEAAPEPASPENPETPAPGVQH